MEPENQKTIPKQHEYSALEMEKLRFWRETEIKTRNELVDLLPIVSMLESFANKTKNGKEKEIYREYSYFLHFLIVKELLPDSVDLDLDEYSSFVRNQKITRKNW